MTKDSAVKNRWTVELEPAEGELVLEILRAELGTLRQQVYHADTHAFRDQLKRREGILEALIARLAGAAPAP